MKQTSKTIICALSLSALAWTASAQVAEDSSSAGTTPSGQEANPEKIQLPEAGPGPPLDELTGPVHAAKAGDLIGMDVVDSQDDKVGSIHEIAVDVESGRIVTVILSTIGFVGLVSSETAVPPGALVHDAEEEHLQLDAGKERLMGAPPFDTSKWSEAFTTERLTEVYKHFGLESDLNFVDETDRNRTGFAIPESRLDGIQRASEIVGTKVMNLENETVGEVEEILIDLPAGRFVAMVVNSGEFLGIEGELSAIPAAAFRFSADRASLRIDTNKANLEAAPHFRRNLRPDFTRADIVGPIYAAHDVEPYFRSGTASARQASLGGARSDHTPATQGESTEDKATTSAIQREIRALETLSPNARNASVVTSEGHTTLSGPVDTAEEKEILGEIANRINRETDVKNQLVVKTAVKTSE